MAQANPANSRPIATPNFTEMAYLLSVPSHLISEGSIPELKTPLSEFPEWADKLGITLGYGEYMFSMTKDGGNEQTQFLFGKPKTPEEAKKPFQKYWKKHGNHRWAPILKRVEVLADYGFPRSTNAVVGGQQGVILGPTYFERYIFIPDCNEGTRFLLEEFQSPFPFKIPTYRTPVATGIQFSAPGISVDFPESLHDDTEFPDLRTSSLAFSAGGTYSSSGSVGGASFPRTNFKGWSPYVVYAEQQQDQSCGVWYMQRIRVYPPQRPRVIRR